ncbi:jg5611, partial [Pararge aegeria aegeria]
VYGVKAVVRHAVPVRIGGLHTPLRTLWRILRHAGFFTMISFTVEASDNLKELEDAPSTSRGTVPVTEDPGPASLVQACSNIENQREVGIWTNPKTKMVHSNVVPHQPLPFTRE